VKLYVEFKMVTRHEYGVETREYVRNDATFLYTLLSGLDLSKPPASGSERMLGRIVKKLRKYHYDAQDFDEEDVRHKIGKLKLNVDQLEFVKKCVDKIEEEGKAFGKDMDTIMMVQDYYDSYKHKHPEKFGKEKKEEKDEEIEPEVSQSSSGSESNIDRAKDMLKKYDAPEDNYPSLKE